MTPHHLHALAAAWSLHTARTRLAQHAADEAAQIAAEALEAPSVLRSPVWGGRHGHGGHGDPTPGMVAIAERPERRNRWAEMDGRSTGALMWLAQQVRTIDAPPVLARILTEGVLAEDGEDDPLGWIIIALDYTLPGTAAAITRHLADEDRWIREAIGVGPDRQPLVGVACPGCAERRLYVQTAGPETAWTVVCATGCRCRGVSDAGGKSCPCGMPGAVEGVAHIWPRHAVLGAVAGAAPTTTREDSPCR